MKAGHVERGSGSHAGQPVLVTPGGCVLCMAEVGSPDPAHGPTLVPQSQDRDPSVETGVRLWDNFCRCEQRVSVLREREGSLQLGSRCLEDTACFYPRRRGLKRQVGTTAVHGRPSAFSARPAMSCYNPEWPQGAPAPTNYHSSGNIIGSGGRSVYNC